VPPPTAEPTQGADEFTAIKENDFRSVRDRPLSTFSVDVDTASYAIVRRCLAGDALPPRDAVRIEEMVNYFPYDYAAPAGDAVFAANVEVSDCPWDREHRLARVALKAREVRSGQRPPCNLVFLIDVSGSMASPNRLPLVKTALCLLVDKLTGRDRVAIVTYAGESGLALPPTPCSEKRKILAALDKLKAEGSTNGGEGIKLA